MNEELTQKLRDEFPVLFGPNEWGCEFLRGFGFECNDGWYELIREFSLAVNELQNPEKPVVALIVKEKFGALEIQGLSNMNDALYEVKRKIYAKSLKTCDICGKPGQLMRTLDGYLLATRCEEHNFDQFHGREGEEFRREMEPFNDEEDQCP